MSQVLGAFWLLDFTMLRPVLNWRAFLNYEPFITSIFQFFLGGGGGRSKLRITETADTESTDTGGPPVYASRWPRNSKLSDSIKILLHVAKTKICLMIVHRCFKICNSCSSHKYIWHTQPVLYGFKFKDMYRHVV